MTNADAAAVVSIGIDEASLIDAGFSLVQADGRERAFCRRDTRVSAMPYLGDVVDNDWIYDSCVATTEVDLATGMVRLSIAETGYEETPVHGLSEEGQGLLRDSLRAPALPLSFNDPSSSLGCRG